MRSRYLVITAVLFVLSLAGCQATTGYYKGAKADTAGVVNLSATQGGMHHWQDLYVTVDYSLEHQGNRLNIAGDFTFSDSPRINFKQVNDMKFKLFLLDKDMRVVDYREVARTLSRDLEAQTPFKQEFQLADNVVAFTFGYEGDFVGEDMSYYRVWKLPNKN